MRVCMQAGGKPEAGHLSPVASPPASPRSVIERHTPVRPAPPGAASPADAAQLANGWPAPASSRDGGMLFQGLCTRTHHLH